MSLEEKYYRTRTGHRMFIRHWRHETPKGVVAIVHGFLEHSGRYYKLADELFSAGWSVVAFDLRGHGYSAGQRGHVDRFRDYIKDLYEVIHQIKAMGYREKPVLLGNSLGGLISTRFVQSYPDAVKALVLACPFFKRAYRVSGVKEAGARVLSKLYPTLALKTGLKLEWRSHNLESLEEYENDELAFDKASTRWYIETVTAQSLAMKEASRVHVPLLVLQSGNDLVVSPEASIDFYHEAFTRDKKLLVYEGFYHEIFQELGAGRVCNDLTDWLDNLSQPYDISLPKEETVYMDA